MTPVQDDILVVDDVHSHYGASHVLQGVSLCVPRGRCVTIMGRNGAGKTTLVHAIVNFHRATSGSIRFNGQEITGLAPDRIVRSGIAIVPQGRRVFPSLTVEEHLRIPSVRSTSGPSRWDFGSLLELFPVLGQRRQQRAGTLSGGEQQMLSIARALVTNPELLVMDEPSEGLAPLVLRQLRTVLSDLRGTDLSLLLVEQNVHLGIDMADYVYILNKGSVVHESTPQALTGNDRIKAEFLGLGS